MRKTISGNGFTPHCVFGCAWKIEFSGKQFHLTVCFMALTRKIFYTSIFPSNDFQTQTRREREREREREHEERLERVRSGSRRWAQTTATSPDVPLSSRWRDLAARSRHRARAREIVLPRSYCEIVPPPSRSNCFRLNLDAAWSLPLLDRSRRPWPLDCSRYPSLCHRFAITLSSSSLSQFDQMVLCIENSFVLIFVSLKVYILQFSIIKFVW